MSDFRQASEDEERPTEAQSAPPGAKSQHSSDLAPSGLPPGLLPYNATMDPLLVHLPSQAARAPTVKECEVIIKHLLRVNDKQSHEVRKKKSK